MSKYRFLTESTGDFGADMKNNATFRRVDRALRSYGYFLQELYYNSRGKLEMMVDKSTEDPLLPEISYFSRTGDLKLSRIPNQVHPEDAEKFLNRMQKAVAALEYLDKMIDTDLDIVHEEDYDY